MICSIIGGVCFVAILIAGIIWMAYNWEDSPDDIWFP